MNMISCYCGREYEDTAVKCPSCWRPRPGKSRLNWIGVGTLVIGTALFIWFFKSDNGNDDPHEFRRAREANEDLTRHLAPDPAPAVTTSVPTPESLAIASTPETPKAVDASTADTLAKLRARRAALLAERAKITRLDKEVSQAFLAERQPVSDERAHYYATFYTNLFNRLGQFGHDLAVLEYDERHAGLEVPVEEDKKLL
jgi:hypothetical protein